MKFDRYLGLKNPTRNRIKIWTR